MYKRYVKRPLDIIAAVTILLLLLPIGLITALIIRITTGSPIIFRQPRTGLHGDNFTMYKYRTMQSNNSVHDTSTENQMTSVGKFVRAASLDEVPQLVNIIKGEMSFIGPRPWIPDYYAAMTPEQRKRCNVMPGITGLAQVKGRNSISVHEKINYDLQYVDNISLREDAKIVLLTARTLFEKGSKYIEKSSIHQEIQILMKDQRG